MVILLSLSGPAVGNLKSNPIYANGISLEECIKLFSLEQMRFGKKLSK